MLSVVTLAVTAIELTTGFGLVVAGERIDLDNGIICDDGMENDFEGLEPAVIDATAEPAATVPLIFGNAATAGLAAFVPWVFVITHAVLSVVYVFRAIARFVRRTEVGTICYSCLRTTQSLRCWCLGRFLYSPWPCPATLLQMLSPLCSMAFQRSWWMLKLCSLQLRLTKRMTR